MSSISTMAISTEENYDPVNGLQLEPCDDMGAEVLLQHGQFHREQMSLGLSNLTQPGSVPELIMISALAIGLPPVVLESVRMLATPVISAVVYAALMLFKLDVTFDAISGGVSYAFSVAFGIFYFFYFGLLYLRLVLMGGSAPLFVHSHIGLSPLGLRTHFYGGNMNFFGSLWRWQDLSGISFADTDKKGRPIKLLKLRFANGKTFKIDLDGFRTEQELLVLSDVLDRFTPRHLVTADISSLTRQLSREKRYTELWTQALLSKPTRTCLSTLADDTELNDGRYKILKQLGSGGQGTAYLAEETYLGEVSQVVLKEYVLPDHRSVHDRRRALKRLESEVDLLGRLSNDHIVALHDVFIQDHRAYMVMEFVDGPSVKKSVSSTGPMAQTVVIDLAVQMCTILEYLHGLAPPMVHQDFTPDNLLISSEGSVKLIDFNVAKEEITLKTSLVVGKQAYMPPEQFKGKACPQSDLFALGATLFYMLTGVEPEPLAVCHVEKHRPDVCSRLCDIIARATSLELEGRYASAAEIARDLHSLKIELSARSSSNEYTTSDNGPLNSDDCKVATKEVVHADEA